MLILGEELLEEGEEERWRGEEEGETWISRTLVVKHRVKDLSKFSSYRAPLSSQDIFCRHHSALHLHMENVAASYLQKSSFAKIDPNLGHENSVLQKLWVVEVNGVLRRGVLDMTRGPGHVL